MNLTELFSIIDHKLSLGCRLKDCQAHLQEYDCDDYLAYVKPDENKYSRQSVISTSRVELVVITWRWGQTSGYHGHPGDCIFKILENSLNEEKIDPTNKITNQAYAKGESGYISNSIGIHNMIAPSDAVSLHIYSPPFA
jgi:hypothetical protein